MTNDKKLETHIVCSNRLEKEGGKARCCRCEPHEGCNLYVVTNDKEIIKLARLFWEEYENLALMYDLMLPGGRRYDFDEIPESVKKVQLGLALYIDRYYKSKLKAKDEEIERLEEEVVRYRKFYHKIDEVIKKRKD